MAKGGGFEISDIMIVGLIAVGGYFLYKTMTDPNNPIKDISSATGSFIGLPNEIYDDTKSTANKIFKYFTTYNYGSNDSLRLPSETEVKQQMANREPIQEVANFGKLKIFQAKDGTFGTYNTEKGELFVNNQGYSTAFPKEMTQKISDVTKSGRTEVSKSKSGQTVTIFRSPQSAFY